MPQKTLPRPSSRLKKGDSPPHPYPLRRLRRLDLDRLASRLGAYGTEKQTLEVALLNPISGSASETVPI